MLEGTVVRGVNVAGQQALGGDIDPSTLSGADAQTYVNASNVFQATNQASAALGHRIGVLATYNGSGPATPLLASLYLWDTRANLWAAVDGGLNVPLEYGMLTAIPVFASTANLAGTSKGTYALVLTPVGSPSDGIYTAYTGFDYSGGAIRGTVIATGPGGAELALEETVGKRFSGGKNTAAAIASASGDTAIYTPAPGKTLTLYWVGLSSSQSNPGEALVTVRLGSKVVYEWFMGNPGAFSHWEPVTADNPDDPLIVALSSPQSPGIAVNFTTTES